MGKHLSIISVILTITFFGESQDLRYSESCNGSYFNLQDSAWDELMISTSDSPDADFFITSFFAVSQEDENELEIREGRAVFSPEIEMYSIYYNDAEVPEFIWFEEFDGQLMIVYQYDPELDLVRYVKSEDAAVEDSAMEDELVFEASIPYDLLSFNWENDKLVNCYFDQDNNLLRLAGFEDGVIGKIEQIVEDNGANFTIVQYLRCSDFSSEEEIPVEVWTKISGDLEYLEEFISIKKLISVEFEGQRYDYKKCM